MRRVKAPKAQRVIRALRRGNSVVQAAAAAGCTRRYARQVGISAGLYTPQRASRPLDPVLREQIRRGYAENLTPPEIAARLKAEFGLITTPASIRVLASRMGASPGIGPAAALRAERRRGFAVPLELLADYDLLRRKGQYSALEAAAVLGLSV